MDSQDPTIEGKREEPAGREGEEQRIDPIEHAAVARNQVAAVFDPGITLEYGLGQIALQANPRDDRAE